MWHSNNDLLLLKFVLEDCRWPHWGFRKEKAPGLFLLNLSLYSVTAKSGICSWRLLQPTPALCLFLCHRFYSQWTSYIPSLIPTLTCQNNKVVYQLRDVLLNPMHKSESNTQLKRFYSYHDIQILYLLAQFSPIKRKQYCKYCENVQRFFPSFFLKIEVWVRHFHTLNMHMYTHM